MECQTGEKSTAQHRWETAHKGAGISGGKIREHISHRAIEAFFCFFFLFLNF